MGKNSLWMAEKQMTINGKYAEDCNYWKTGKASPDTWIEKSIELIKNFGGELLSSAFGQQLDKSAYMIQFKLEGQNYKIIWPVLESKNGDDYAARRQSATMLYHDIKAKLISSQILGTRSAFFQWVQLPDGRPAVQLSGNELIENIPTLLLDNRKGATNE